MPGPWDKFKPQSDESGPWAKFAPSPVAQKVPQPILDNLREKSAEPTQFEKDRPGSNRPGGGLVGQFMNTVGSMLTPSGDMRGLERSNIAPSSPQIMDQKQAIVNSATAEDQARKSAGYNVPYRVAAPFVPGAPQMEESARRGDTSGVIGAAAAPASAAIATYAAPKAIRAVREAVPSIERAEANFNIAMDKAGKVPIDTTAPGNLALEMKEKAARGGRLPKVVNDFIKEGTDPNAKPIDFEAGRDYYSNAGELSVEEKNALKPKVKRQLVRFNKALGASNEAAADAAGVGDQYRSAMKEYRRAKQLQNIKEGAKDIGIGAVKHAIPIGVGGYAAKKIIDDLR